MRPPVPIHFPAEATVPEGKRHLELRTAVYQILKREVLPTPEEWGARAEREREALARRVSELEERLGKR